MSHTTRTFFAIEIPELMETALRELQKTLAPEVPDCRWTREHTSFHMTLAFLGDVPNAELDRLLALLQASVSRCAPVDLRFLGLGAFPTPRRPNVIWAGLTAREPALLDEIQRETAAAVVEAGFPTDDRFHPHVTLGRFKPGRRGPCDLTEVVERYRTWSCGEFRACEVVAFASHSTAQGPRYEPLGRARFEGEKSTPSP